MQNFQEVTHQNQLKTMKDDAVALLTQFIGINTDQMKYLHNTASEQVANCILKGGFNFEKYLENTTDPVSGLDIVEIRYFMNTRCCYGDYTIVIAIGRNLVTKYSEMLLETDCTFVEALTTEEPQLSADEEYIYTLHPQFVKGYINQADQVIVKNPGFAPYKDLAIFEDNVRMLLKQS